MSLAIWLCFAANAYATGTTIAAGALHTVGINPDGTVVTVGDVNTRGQLNVSAWTDVVAVGAGAEHTVGLRSDGTVLAVGSNDCGQTSVSSWTDIVAVSAGWQHTVGLRSDGTVLSTQEGAVVSSWTDIVAIATGSSFTVGLKADGTVVTTAGFAVESLTDIVAVAAGDTQIVGLRADGTVTGCGWNLPIDVSFWTDIVAVAAGGSNTVGIKSDGTVVAAGQNNPGQLHVSTWSGIVEVAVGPSRILGITSDSTVLVVGEDARRDAAAWKNMVAVATSESHTVGIRSDATVVAVGQDDSGQCDVASWTNIVAVAASNSHTVGVRSDGTVAAVGQNTYGQCDVASWTDIVAVVVPPDGNHTVGLKSDGTVVATGYNGSGQTNVTAWTNIVAVAADNRRSVGVTSDGRYVGAGDFRGDDPPGYIGLWAFTNLRFLALREAYFWGLHKDGTVSVANYGWFFPVPEGVQDWTGINAVSPRSGGAVGLKSDGTVVACGLDSSGETSVSAWTDIVAIAADNRHTVGLKSDGAVVVTGGGAGACNVSTWRLLTPLPIEGAQIGAINEAYEYTASRIRPIPVVKLGTRTLMAGRDYAVIYSGNVMPGTATITITGVGAYSGTVTKYFTVLVPVSRVAGTSRYDVAANLARKGWDPKGDKSWTGVTHVIVACGDNGKEADPLAAAGLAGVYDCPVLLTGMTALPDSTKIAITEIAKANPDVKVHLIGGVNSVPDARWTTIKAIPNVSQTKDRIWGRSRYDVSVAIANRMVSVAGGAGSLGDVLIVAGDNVSAFYDALAASPISYAETMPILSVQKGVVPPSVATILSTTLKGKVRYVVNSSTYVSDATKTKVGATTRLTTSSNRYTAATQIASTSISRGWLDPKSTAVAAKLPDALTGGVFSGKNGGVMLFTDSTSVLQPVTKTFITTNKSKIVNGWVFGGLNSVPSAQETSYRNLLK